MFAEGITTLEDLLQLQKLGEFYPDFNASFIPPGFLDPNYIPPYNGTGMVVSAIVMSVLMLIVVPLRLYTRTIWRKGTWGWDDTFIVPAFIMALSLNALDLIEVYYAGLGHHVYDLSIRQLIVNTRFQFAHLHLYFWVANLTKLSILSFYIRLQPDKMSFTSRFIRALMVFLCALTLTSTLLLFFHFKPIKAGWDLTAFLQPVEGGTYSRFLLIISIIYTIMDFVIWAIPIPMVWKLNVSLRRRLDLLSLFGLGFGCCIIIVVRTALVYQAFNTFDATWARPHMVITNQLEAGIGIIVASLPALGVVYFSFFIARWSSFVSIVRTRWSRQSQGTYGYSGSQTHNTRNALADKNRWGSWRTTNKGIGMKDLENENHERHASGLKGRPPFQAGDLKDNVLNFTSPKPSIDDTSNFYSQAPDGESTRSRPLSDTSLNLVIQRQSLPPAGLTNQHEH
jgi:hypothetical protein